MSLFFQSFFIWFKIYTSISCDISLFWSTDNNLSLSLSLSPLSPLLKKSGSYILLTFYLVTSAVIHIGKAGQMLNLFLPIYL
jgi:hypothetical protein